MPQPSGWCFWHDPAISEEQKQVARQKGGQARAREIAQRNLALALPADAPVLDTAVKVRQYVQDTIHRVQHGVLAPSRANAITSLLNLLVRVHEIELDRELAAILEREEAAQQAAQRGPRPVVVFEQ